MPVSTIIDILFDPKAPRKKIKIEERVFIPVGQEVTWRLKPASHTVRDFHLDVRIVFQHDSPFEWSQKTFKHPNYPTSKYHTLSYTTAQREGEFKYDVFLEGNVNGRRFECDEDPYLIIRQF